MESRKIVLMELFAGKEWRCRRGEWNCGYSEGRENDIDIYTPPCVQQIAEKKLLYNTGSPAWCSVMA